LLRSCSRARRKREATVPRGSPRAAAILGHVHLLELIEQEHRAQRFAQALDGSVEEGAHLPALGHVFGRSARLARLGQRFAGKFPLARVRAAGVKCPVTRDLAQEAALRAQPDIVEAVRDDDERPLDLVVQLVARNAALSQRTHNQTDGGHPPAIANAPGVWR
jgi:hypothetical protein